MQGTGTDTFSLKKNNIILRAQTVLILGTNEERLSIHLQTNKNENNIQLI
jgi:hypothetical protein